MSYTYKYPRPALTVDAIIIGKTMNQEMLLLILRKSYPFKGKWALPGGFVEMNETLEEACKRELKEETGFELAVLQQYYVFDAIDRDPRGRTISTVFYGFTNEVPSLTAGDDAQEAKWFALENLPELAFDHKEIIAKFIREKMITVEGELMNR